MSKRTSPKKKDIASPKTASQIRREVRVTKRDRQVARKALGMKPNPGRY